MTTSLNRRDLIRLGVVSTAGLGLAPLLAACATPAPVGASQPAGSATVKPTPKAATVTVQVGIQNVEFAGSLAADAKGLMQAVNITQQLLPFGPNVQPVTVVAGGSALAGVIGGADTFLKARASGIPVVAIGTMYQKAPSGLVSLAKNPIRTPKDAVGKKIGLQAGARGPWATILSLAGLKESDMTIVPVQFDPTPLVQGQVDGFWSFAFNQPLVLQAQGLDTVFMTAFDAGYKFYGDVIITTDTAVKANADELGRWLGATQKGWDYAFANVDEIAKLVAGKDAALNLDIKQQTSQLKAEKDFMTSSKPLFTMDQATWQAGIDILKSLSQIDKPITAAEVMNTSILELAAKGS
ncbi:MAG TPA: ABC transporter substrate-binding protein [Patescibacteria group bacterium]|nr:ABC transporter substrate-binding protein [Patescibacteria group bacterium]